MAEVSDAHVAEYLEHVGALIRSAQSMPGDPESEHTIVTELFPGFLALARRVKALADQLYGERGNDYSASALYGSKLRKALREELLGEEERR